jgi:hypothetical protein
LPTSHGIAMAVIVYPATAAAINILKRKPKSGSDGVGESSMEFCAGRDGKVCEGLPVVCGGGGGLEDGQVWVEGGVKNHVGWCAP